MKCKYCGIPTFGEVCRNCQDNPQAKKPLIVAFFQMNWFNQAKGNSLQELTSRYADPVIWRDMIALTESGKVLKRVFGDLYDQIFWRMPNPGLKKDPASQLDFDAFYVRGILMSWKPDIVIALGPSACASLLHEVLNFAYPGVVLTGNHPLDAGSDTSLSILAQELQNELNVLAL